MIIKSCFCGSLRDYQSLKRKFSSFSRSNIYSPPFLLKLSLTWRWGHPGQPHFHAHCPCTCQEGTTMWGQNPSRLSEGSVTQMLIAAHHSSQIIQVMAHLQLRNTSEEVFFFFSFSNLDIISASHEVLGSSTKALVAYFELFLLALLRPRVNTAWSCPVTGSVLDAYGAVEPSRALLMPAKGGRVLGCASFPRVDS